MRSDSGAIMLVANYPSDVGYAWWLMENFWVLIAEEMRRRGRRVLLAYPKIRSVPDVIREAGIELLEARLRPRTLWEALHGARLLRRYGVTSVYVTDWPGLWYVYTLWRLAGVKRIVLHDHTPGVRPPVTGFRAWCKTAAYTLRIASCTTYVGVSDYVRQRFIDNWRVPPDRCFVVRNGIREFSCDHIERSQVRASISVPHTATLVILVSRATFYKGWDFALATLRELLSGLPIERQPHFVFCGTGPDLDAFRKVATDLGVERNAHFLGHRSDVRSILCSADVAFHPSKGEALSLSTLEYMCAALPVIVPDQATVCTVTRHGVDGLIYPAESVEAAAAAIRVLATDDVLRERLGSAAKSSMLAGYRLEETNKRFKSVVLPEL